MQAFVAHHFLHIPSYMHFDFCIGPIKTRLYRASIHFESKYNQNNEFTLNSMLQLHSLELLELPC